MLNNLSNFADKNVWRYNGNRWRRRTAIQWWIKLIISNIHHIICFLCIWDFIKNTIFFTNKLPKWKEFSLGAEKVKISQKNSASYRLWFNQAKCTYTSTFAIFCYKGIFLNFSWGIFFVSVQWEFCQGVYRDCKFMNES